MKKKMIFVAVVVAVILVGTAFICGASAPKKGGTLIYATGTDANSLDPQFVTDVPTSRVVMHIHQTLVYPDTELNPQPALAESWTISDDKLTWTFKLQKGVKFHDGTPFNAQAVKFTFDRMMDPATGSPRKSTTVALKEVKVIDDHTVAFTTKKPFAPILAQLGAYNLAILSPAAVKKWGKKYNEHPSGTGPFKLESWNPGEKMVLVRNDDFRGEKSYIDKLEIRIVPEDSSRVMLLLSGGVDVIASVPPIMLKRLEKSKDVKILRKTGLRVIYIGLNNKVKPFDNQKVRQAVAHAIDPKAILGGVLGGVGTLGGSFEPPGIPGSISLPVRKYDPELSKQLLAEAGFPNGFTTTFYTPTGRYTMDRQVAEAVQAQVKEIGIDAKIQTPDWGTYIAALNRYDYVPMFLLGKGSPTGDQDLTCTLSNVCNAKMNHFGYCNPKVSELVEQQRGALDPKKRFEILAEIQRIMYEEVPQVTLFYEVQLYGARANVHGVKLYTHEFVNFSKAWKE
jgi:peptide/nickel transport system substrate-binding protein